MEHRRTKPFVRDCIGALGARGLDSAICERAFSRSVLQHPAAACAHHHSHVAPPEESFLYCATTWKASTLAPRRTLLEKARSQIAESSPRAPRAPMQSRTKGFVLLCSIYKSHIIFFYS